MISYQVPTVLRRLSPQQVFDEGITSFLGVGIFLYLAAANKAFSIQALNDFTEVETFRDIHDALGELEQAGLIERTQIIDDLDTADVELGGAA